MRVAISKTLSITLISLLLLVAFSTTETSANNNLEFHENNITDGISEETWKWGPYNINGLGDYAYLNQNFTRIIIRFEDEENGYNKLAAVASESNISIVNRISMKGKTIAAVVEIRLELADFFVADLQKFGLVEYAEPNIKFQTTFTPDDVYWRWQWNLQKIEVDWAWNTTVGSHSVLVAVVDTGIDYNHPDLSANYAPFGYDWVNNDTDPIDDNGHGTHCAGIIAGVTNNHVGIAGIAQVRVMVEKGLDNEGVGYTDQLVQAIIDAADKGANIISMSWGSYVDSELMHEAIKYAYDSGVLLVAAAGNLGLTMRSFPAAYDEVIAVAATDEYDELAYFSNFGEWIEISAPGGRILSTISANHDPDFNYPYDYLSGTSMAAPHVAGVASLILSQYPNLTQDQLRIRLWYSTDDLGYPGFDIYYGYGRINARKAVENVFPEHDLIITAWKKPPYLEPESNSTIYATVFNFGKSDEANIEVQLLVNGSLSNNVTIDFLSTLTFTTINLTWSPLFEGTYNVTVSVVPLLEETQLLNNNVCFYIQVGIPIKTVVLDSYGTDSPLILNWDSLNNNWRKYGDKFIYIDYVTLNKENITYNDLVASDADVLIISCAYVWEFTDSEIEAIKKYVYEGHGLIATAGTFFFTAPNNNKLASLFGLSESINWESTMVQELKLVKSDHPLFLNIPNPYGFPEIGTAVPSVKKWDLSENAGGSYIAIGPKLEAAVVTYKGLVYISPFLEGIIYLDDDFHHNLQLLYNAIKWSCYQRQEHDLSPFLECPSHIKPNETVNLNITISNSGSRNETDVKVCLMINGTVLENKTIVELSANSSITFSQTLATPNVEAIYNISVYVYPVVNENYTEDNLNVKILKVTNAAIIGIIRTHWESLYDESLPDYCTELGYIVERIYENLSFNVLNKCDVILVSYYYKPWLPSEIEAVKSYIESRNGFLAIGDRFPEHVQEILEYYGISYAGVEALIGWTTNFNHLHPIMRGVNGVYVPGWYPRDPTTFNSLKVEYPAYWIANDSSNEHIVIAGAEVNGRVLCLSSFFDNEVLNNAKMFKNIFEWLTKDVTPPAITVLSPENKTYITTSVPLTFTVNETTSWIGYSLDNEQNITITGNTTLIGLSETKHSITLYASDSFDNTGSSDTVYFTISLPFGPKAEFKTIPETPSVHEYVKFDASTSSPGWNGTHKMPIVEYRWDFGDSTKETTSTPIVHHKFASSGTHHVTLTVYSPGAIPELASTTHEVIVKLVVGGYSSSIEACKTVRHSPLYPGTVAILITAFLAIKRKKCNKKV